MAQRCGPLAAMALALCIAGGAHADPEPYDPDEDMPEEPYHVRGWLEHARLMPVGLLLDAKLDSGARTSSIDAEILDGSEEIADDLEIADVASEPEEDEGEEPDVEPGEDAVYDIDHDDEAIDEDAHYVVFRITNESGRSRVLRREIVRWVEVKRRGGGTMRRPVVHLEFCIAGVWAEGEVNLADRSGFNYPLLIGRNMLNTSAIIIDSREVYSYRSTCEPPEDYDAD